MNNYYYFKSLHARDVGLFKELDIKFNEKFNFIIGPNASGKTSILKCIAVLLNFVKNVNVFRYGEKPELWLDVLVNSEHTRFGHVGRIQNGNIYRGARYTGIHTAPHDGFRSLSPKEFEKYQICPLVIGSYRNIQYIPIEGLKREKNPASRREMYRKNAIPSLESGVIPSVKGWMVNRAFIINQDWAEEEKMNWEWLFSNFSNISPPDLNFNYNEVGRDLEPEFDINGLYCYLEELSAGFQAVLSLIFAIFDWVEGINEEGNKLVKYASGTVIIDELDIHLHPEWQFSIRGTLETLFPKLQFIVTTHSPHLISTAKKGEIIKLPKITRKIRVQPSNESYAGWTTDQILEDLMGVVSLRNKSYEVLVDRAIKSYETNNFEHLKQNIKELEKIVHPSDIIVTKLKIKLAELKLTKNDKT